MGWIAMSLRGAPVLARCDESGALVVEGGRVEIRYAVAGKPYRAALQNLERGASAAVAPDEHVGAPDVRKKAAPAPRRAVKKTEAGEDAKPGTVIVYADGACSGNPGPAGLGVVLIDADGRRELSEYLGNGTNNIAELTAILRAAEALHGSTSAVRIHTDSRYSIGVLTQGWKAKKNPDLVAKTKLALSHLQRVELRYVPGHAGVELNERADELARGAVVARRNAGWQRA